uniref:NAD(P)H dehydrogenase (quinone) n=1 Tax=Noccaea caerulescens TaxID=107243 RepID=A0A1J3C821_NOCCA
MEAVRAIKPLIRVVALSGSLRKGSYNTGLLRAAIELTKESVPGMHIEYIDISLLPLINTDLETNGYPPVVEVFRQKIRKADSILFASPEYNFSVSAPLKNAIDWASRSPNVWADKPAAVVSTGGGRSQYHLRQIGVFLGLHFINEPEFTLNAFQPPKKFDAEGNLVDGGSKERLKQFLVSLQAFTLRLRVENVSKFSTQMSEDPEQLQEIHEKRRERRKWTPTEDIMLCSSWLNTSKVVVVGNEQKTPSFWKRIASYFNSSPKLAGFQKREAGHCKHRWNKINDNVRKFVGCYEAAKRQKTSGCSDTDVRKVAYEIFFNDHKVKFNLEHAWMELCNDQKWCASSTCKGEGSSKRRKLDDQSTSSHTFTQLEDQQMARPQGVKAAKAKGKRSVSKSGTEESESTSLLEFQRMQTIKEKKNLAVKERLSKVGLLDSLIARKKPLSELEMALKNKLITDMLSN